MKIHKKHLNNVLANKQGEKQIAPCKVYYDANAAMELFLLASSIENQQEWTACLRKKIEQDGYAAVNRLDEKDLVNVLNLSTSFLSVKPLTSQLSPYSVSGNWRQLASTPVAAVDLQSAPIQNISFSFSSSSPSFSSLSSPAAAASHQQKLASKK